MISNNNNWEKLGRFLSPAKEIFWLESCTGSACAIPESEKESIFKLYVTGRDKNNRSFIGKILIKISDSGEISILEISKEPVLKLGELGSFDENGTSYPYVICENDFEKMYYTGWMPSVLTPFQNQLGLAIKKKEETEFSRYSKAPILSRTNEDNLSIGSVCVLKEKSKWHLWYTSFIKWKQTQTKPKHYYLIKYAYSSDGINWKRENKVCIDFSNRGEYAIAKPSVIKINEYYHMYFCFRGNKYKIGYAYSKDRVYWKRDDSLAGISYSKEGWDSEEMCYPFVFRHKEFLYMLYCGNDYGKEGLGLARLKIKL